MLTILLTAIVIINLLFIYTLVKDLIKHKDEVMSEPASTIWTPIAQVIIYFLSTFGISDFAISTALYPKAKCNGFGLH